jgi:dipeptide/tripeptide permease
MTVTTPIPDDLAPGDKRPGWGKVLRDQKKSILVALAMAVAAFWIAGQLGEWRLAGCIAGGVGLGLANHLATERWLLKTISSGEEVTRNKLAAATFVRLLILTAVAVGIAVILWPDGIGLLLGLAIFRLIALVMTIIPLLRELKKDANTP